MGRLTASGGAQAGGGFGWLVQKHGMAACLVSSAFMALSDLLFNGQPGETLTALAPFGRDWSTLAGACVLAVLALVAMRVPRFVLPRVFSVAAVALAVAGYGISVAAVGGLGEAPVVLGMCLSSVGEVWVGVVWLLAASTLEMGQVCLCLSVGSLAAMPLALLLAPLPFAAASAIDLLASVASLALCLPLVGGFFGRLAQAGVPADRRITHPAAVLPPTHRLFVGIFAFSVALGYALRFGDGAGGGAQGPAMSAVPALAMLGIVAYTLLRRARPRADSLFKLSLVLVVAGFLLVLVGGTGLLAGVAASTLVAGYLCFVLMTRFVLCSIAARSVVEAIPAIAWGTAVGYLGILAGALVGLPAGTGVGGADLAARLIVAGMALALVAFAAYQSGSIGIDDAIEGVEPDLPIVELRVVDTVEEACRRAVDRYQLTPREGEVLGLLARGNTPGRIQEELSISRNTVKYHCRNIYDKLGVHSQQDLIDLLAGV